MSQHQQQAALPAIILGVNGQQCTHTHAGQQGYRPNQGRLSGNPITGWRSFTTRQQETFSMCTVLNFPPPLSFCTYALGGCMSLRRSQPLV